MMGKTTSPICQISKVDPMHQDQTDYLPAPPPAVVSGGSGEPSVEISRLLGTVVSNVTLSDDGILELKGRDSTGEERWRLSIAGSARFTFSPNISDKSWLVEANFDAGGSLRSSDRAMILAVCGAVIASVRAENEGLLILSDDGRAIEVPYALNEESVVINILPDKDHHSPCRIVLRLAC